LQYSFRMRRTSRLLDRLHDETRAHRVEADSDLDYLFAPDVIPANYLLFLMRTYGFEAPLESALATTPGLELAVDLRSRVKAGFIAQDLLALGVRASEVTDLPQCLAVPQFRSAIEAIGWMYVTERHTLVHGVLHRHLETKLAREMTHAASYLTCYESIAGRRWSELCDAIEHLAQTRALEDRLIFAAHDAYRCHRRWLHHEPERRVAS